VNTVNQQYSEARVLESRLRTSVANDQSDILDLMRQIVYRQFTLQVLQQLRAVSHVEDPELHQEHQGLSFDIVHSVLGERPVLVHVRRGRQGLGNTYLERFQGLFNWDDGIPCTFWDECYYWQLARKFHRSISASVSSADADDWKASLGRQALPYFWIIPNYSKHSLFTLLVKTGSRTSVTRALISGIYKWDVEGSSDFSDEGQWLFGGLAYISGYPQNHIGQRHGSPRATEVVPQPIPDTRD
jgi:hypothetical protein